MVYTNILVGGILIFVDILIELPLTLLLRPFNTGDWVETGNVSGTIKEVGLFTTIIDTFNINAKTKLSEYTVHLENVNGNIQSQKVLVMNYGAGVGLTAYSSEYGIMFHPNQIADIGVAVNAGICSLTATTKTGITGITTFSLVRQDQS